MIKKLVALALSLAFCVGCLAGCSCSSAATQAENGADASISVAAGEQGSDESASAKATDASANSREVTEFEEPVAVADGEDFTIEVIGTTKDRNGFLGYALSFTNKGSEVISVIPKDGIATVNGARAFASLYNEIEPDETVEDVLVLSDSEGVGFSELESVSGTLQVYVLSQSDPVAEYDYSL